ncbi:hypothetical protein EPO15_11750 [bacterium]|nr:MAG: hypothetical protein EPO15_11750 [bacterium]
MPLRFAGPLLAALFAASARAHPGHVHLRPLPQEQVQAAQQDMGRCVGREPGAPARVAAGEPYDLKKSPLAAEERAAWEKLDYRADEKAGRLLNPDGSPVPAAEVERLRAPFDAAKEELDANLWAWLVTSGYRLDEKACRFKDPSGAPFTRLAGLTFALEMKKAFEHSALEDLRAGLSKLKPGDPVPDGLRERAALLEKQGLALPPAVKKALQGAAKAGDVTGPADDAYAASTRLFDQAGWHGALSAASPAIRGLTEAAKLPTYADDPERRLGAALTGDIAAVLGETPSGRELLGRFKDKSGKPDMPAVLMLKLSQRAGDAGYGQAGAVASPDGGHLTLNFWAVRGAALTAVPEAERKALAKRLSTPEALGDWLLAHPEARRAFVREVDTTVFHELTHCWQARRGRFEVEMLRGNAPQVNPLEKEHEAYRAQLMYFHDKLKADPAGAIASPEFQTYQALLADYGQYKESITRTYMTTFPGSSDFKTAAELQKERRRISERLGRSDWAEWGRQALRRVGFQWGDAALRSAAEDSRAREQAFEAADLPRMRREGTGVLVGHFAKDRPAFALAAARMRGAETTKEQRVALFEQAVAELRKPGGDAERRAQDMGHLAGYLNERETDGPADFSALQRKVYTDAANLYLARADKAEGAERARWVEWAEAYAKGADDKALLADIARRREKAK